MTLTFQIVCLLFQVSKETYYGAKRDLLKVSTWRASLGLGESRIGSKNLENILKCQKRSIIEPKESSYTCDTKVTAQMCQKRPIIEPKET
jgi:hypothetical protein